MANITNKQLLQHLIALENKIVTLQAMIVALAVNSGFSADEITTKLDDIRPKVMVMDPGPVEVDPEV
ncbi:hypothetical protein SOP89_08705 [Pseudomonas siliginis]|uniref:hypothetical protein n=1 Tax=Pseudomonas siliginis TaxID=2842346 RepID=UPI002B250C56|nr:hypothetical protein [Pseudomonas siliginis]MEB2651453.1 hypothetical protein [Pseudomonas siliginis]